MSAGGGGDLAVLAVGIDAGRLEGFSVESAEDLLGALAHLSDGGIDVICATLDLPDAQGLDVVRSFREQAGDVPVVVLGTAGVDGQLAFDAGATDVIPADAPVDLVARAVRYAATVQRLSAELHRHQTVDDLTGLLNARGFELLATHHLRLADRSKHPVVIVFVRMDDVPEPERDRVVIDAAEMIRAAVRASDVVARVGSDAFCVLLSGASPGSESIVLSRVVESVAEHDARAGRETGSTLWVGAAEYDPERPLGLQELIAEADRRMRRAGGEP
jgi:diguanylate cyclase (GGDEF)-like protein